MTSLLPIDQGNLVTLPGLPVGADLVAELRAINTESGRAVPRFWQLTVEHDDDPTWGSGPAVWLNAGLGGDAGALCWVDRTGTYIPADGRRALGEPAAWLAYFDWTGEECGVHVALRVSIERVFAAVAEVVASRQRPRTVAWAAVNEAEHRLVQAR